MTAHLDHRRYEDDLAAYLLGALSDDEARGVKRHLEGCARCQERARWLQASVELLPTAVEQREPPPALRERLMQTVRAEAEAARPADRPARPQRAPSGRHGPGRLGGLLAIPRPAMAIGAVLLAVAGGVVGYAVGSGGGEPDTATVVAQAPPGASATLERDGDSGILRVSGLPQRPNRIYEVWLARGDEVRPAGLFQVDRRGRGAAGIPGGLEEADRVMVTLEPPGGSEEPTSDPLVIAEI